MNIKKAKKLLIKKAKKMFPEIKKEFWTFETLEWSDGSFSIKYFNTYNNKKEKLRRVFCYKKRNKNDFDFQIEKC